MTAKNPKGKAGAGDAWSEAKIIPCGIRVSDLQRSFDGEGDAPLVADHVTGCDSCNTALVLLQAQRDAVSYLTSAPSRISAKTAVERILMEAASSGRNKLADLLYETAKACLVMLPNVKRRIERRVEPRGFATVTSELKTIASRLGTTATGVTLLHLQDVPLGESNALSTASTCLSILENVEGQSERQCLAYSQVLIFSGNPVAAEDLLRRVLARGDELAHKDLAEWNIMFAMMRQRKHADAVNFGTAVLLQRPDDGVILYNLAACYAWLRNHERFEAMSARLASLLARSDEGAPEWLISLLRHEAPEFASCFDLTIEAIERKFGLSKFDRRAES